MPLDSEHRNGSPLAFASTVRSQHRQAYFLRKLDAGFHASGVAVSTHDYRITAEVRRHLVSRWIDVSLLQIGTTNGVVYIIGSFEPTVDDALQRVGQAPERDPIARLVRLVTLVDRELRRMPRIRDVVFNLRNIRRKGGVWRAVGAKGEVAVARTTGAPERGRRRHARGTGTRQDEMSDEEANEPGSGDS